jgi:dTDP-4-amino-4,6-dideoxygalactose transaminase
MNDKQCDIPFARPFIGKEEEDAVLRVLRSGWLTTGPEALAFEREFKAFLEHNSDGAAPPLYCLAVNSATSGLHLALEAAGVGPGDLVFLPSYTFTSTAETVRYLGAESVFVDIAPDSYNIDPAALEDTLSRIDAGRPVPGLGERNHAGKPKAVIAVHFGGLPCDMQALADIARRRNLVLLEDAAHALPAYCQVHGRRRPAGTIGDIGVFSFYATKTLTTGEGGMVVTASEHLARRVSLTRCHGIDRAVWNRYTDAAASWYYEVRALGYKYNLPDILATLGRVQLSRAHDLLAMRRDIAARYDKAFAGVPELAVPPTSPTDVRHLYPLRLNTGGRDAFIERMQRSGIGVSVHFIPLHIMPYYRERYDLAAEDFPETLKRFRETVSLPVWPGMTAEQTDRVISAVYASLKPPRHWKNGIDRVY